MNIIANILNAIDAVTGTQDAPTTHRTPATKRKRTSGRVDHAITAHTPRHDIYMTCGVCIPAPRHLGITGSNGAWHVPWLSQVGVKVLDFDWGGVGSDGHLWPPYIVTDTWNPDTKTRLYPTAQWVRITVRGDNGVPNWAEMLCAKYEQEHGKARYWKDKTGIVNPQNWRYARNAHGVPMPMQHRQRDCTEVMTPPDMDRKPRR